MEIITERLYKYLHFISLVTELMVE